MVGFRTTDEALLKKTTSLLNSDSGKTMLWNDQTVQKTASASKAHAKGILHYDEATGGFLFLHSIPHFVDNSDGTFKSTTRETSMYGQSMVCLSLETERDVNRVIDHVMSENAEVYLNTFTNTAKPRAKIERMISSMPFGFTLVTKTSFGEEHPFEEMLVEHFKSSWLVNTWGRPYKASVCNQPFKVSNVIFKNLNSVTTKYTQDHSKWALSYGDERRIVCVGDLNHMESQAGRGGSFLCVDDPALYRTIFATLLSDECDLLRDYKP